MHLVGLYYATISSCTVNRMSNEFHNLTFYLFRSRNHFSFDISARFLLITSKGLFERDSTDSGVYVFNREQETAAVKCWVCVLLRTVGRQLTISPRTFRIIILCFGLGRHSDFDLRARRFTSSSPQVRSTMHETVV